MNMSSYLDQYKRMMRYYKRFKKINEGKAHYEHSDNSRDDALSFFIHCYHLKDWIKNDQKIGILPHVVESFVHNEISLRISGDICNGIKHLILDNPKLGNGAKMAGSHLSLYLGGQEPILRMKYNIEVDGNRYNAFEIATQAISSWNKFLNKYIKDFNAVVGV